MKRQVFFILVFLFSVAITMFSAPPPSNITNAIQTSIVVPAHQSIDFVANENLSFDLFQVEYSFDLLTFKSLLSNDIAISLKVVDKTVLRQIYKYNNSFKFCNYSTSFYSHYSNPEITAFFGYELNTKYALCKNSNITNQAVFH